jgi:S1-C subfamily serine protease
MTTETGRRILFALGYFVSALVGLLIGGLIMLLAISVVAGVSPGDLLSGSIKGEPSALQKITITPKRLSTDVVVAVSKKMQPSVVNVRTTEVITDLFHEGREVKGVGSGVIFRDDGYVITNFHVVEGATDIFVTIGNEDVKGQVVGGDRDTDIAVIKIPRKGLPAAEFGSSKDLQVGELVVAIGSPFGFEHTVTSGIISALHRTITTEDQAARTYTDLIQTDAAINPGNSGGALANEKGQVVGINTLIFSPSGASAGLGFAVSIETAKDVANQLIEKGRASHPFMGITGQDVDENLARRLKLSVKEGAIIVSVASGSPADKVGLKKNDVIVTFEGKPVKNMNDLIAAIRAKNIGDTVTIEYVRDSKRDKVSLTIAEKPTR